LVVRDAEHPLALDIEGGPFLLDLQLCAVSSDLGSTRNQKGKEIDIGSLVSVERGRRTEVRQINFTQKNHYFFE
jgi:hypothetical protein